jgi:hypothetical protein
MLSPSSARIQQGVNRLLADGIVASSWVFHSLAELGLSVPGLGHGALGGYPCLKNPPYFRTIWFILPPSVYFLLIL